MKLAPTDILSALMNSARRVSDMFPGHFQGVRHNHSADFGWPTKVSFELLYEAYCRDSVAEAAIEKTAAKVWETQPTLRLEGFTEGSDLTTTEQMVADHFKRIRFWQRLHEAEKRGLVGNYSGVILQIADNQEWLQPVSRAMGIEKLVSIIPAWQGQLTVSEWYTDTSDELYGQPKMFAFNEASVGDNQNRSRSVEIHPDRVVVWSDTGDVDDTPLMRAGYNDLMDLQKIRGAGGEGFWKASKGAPILKMDKDARAKELAQMMGVPVEELLTKIGDHLDEFNKGFHNSLVLQGMETSSLDVNLPTGDHSFMSSLSCFAASINMPVKILVGMQTGERASTEDAKEWAKTCKSRRDNHTIPNIQTIIERLASFGVIAESEWEVDWDDLTEANQTEKMGNAKTMAEINKTVSATGELVFLPMEIRDAAGYKQEPENPEDLQLDTEMQEDEFDDEEEDEETEEQDDA